MKYLLFRLTAYLKEKDLLDKCYIVGGAVRDIIFRRDIKDLDVAIDGDIEFLVKDFSYAVGGSLICLDKEMSIFRIVKNKRWIDISRLRCGSLYIDLSERDLTINAMAIPLSRIDEYETYLIDPFGGYEDLLNGVIRMVREENFIKDPLRILRVFRFSVTLGFHIESDTLETVTRFASYLNDVARERIYEEIYMIIMSQTSSDIVRLMKERRILTHVFALVFTDTAIQRYSRMELLLRELKSRFVKNNRIFQTYLNDRINYFCLKFFILFEDIRDIIPSGLSLKISKREADKLRTFTNYQGMLFEGFKHRESYSSEYIIKLLYDLGDDIYGIILIDTIRYAEDNEEFIEYVEQLLSFYKGAYEKRLRKIPLLTGDDIIKVFNLTPSPIFKEMISHINIMTLLGEVSNKDEAIDLISKKYGLAPRS